MPDNPCATLARVQLFHSLQTYQQPNHQHHVLLRKERQRVLQDRRILLILYYCRFPPQEGRQAEADGMGGGGARSAN